MSKSLLRNYLPETQDVSARCRCLAPERLINGDYNAKDSSNHSQRVADCRVDSSNDRSSRAPHAQGGPRAVSTSQQFRNANDSLAWPSAEQQSLSDYSEGHVISAPAGQ